MSTGLSILSFRREVITGYGFQKLVPGDDKEFPGHITVMVNNIPLMEERFFLL